MESERKVLSLTLAFTRCSYFNYNFVSVLCIFYSGVIKHTVDDPEHFASDLWILYSGIIKHTVVDPE